jgi:hypothetical protein
MGQIPSPGQRIVSKSGYVAELSQNRSADGKLDLVTNNTLYSEESPDGSSDFTIAANPGAMQLTGGGKATSEISLLSLNGFIGSVQLACQNLPPTMFCTFTPPVLQLEQGERTSSQLTIAAVQPKFVRPSAEGIMVLAMIPMLGGMFFWRGPGAISKAGLLLLLASLMLFSACGGLAAPAGQTYPIAVLATASNGASNSVQISVTVQQ